MPQDYIIVGAGSAGCVMAERLSRDGQYRVLLIEAGGKDSDLFVHMPRGVSRVMEKVDQVWAYSTEAAPGTAGQSERWLRGRMLGGSSSINGMIYNRGQPQDWDAMETEGGSGWGWSSILPYFKSVEDQSWGSGADHGRGGPLHVSHSRAQGPFDQAVIAAGEAMGLRPLEDLNTDHGEGVIGFVSRTIRKGRRWSAAQAFLRQALNRPNLRVVTGVTAERVVIEGGRAVGVQCSGALTGIERAGREVILAAGALESPRLLQLSGVGPAGVLKAAGVQLVRESPEVGRNVIEHRCMTTRWRTRPGYSVNREYHGARVLANGARWLVGGGGPLSAPYADIAAFMRIAPETTRPDAMMFVAPYTTDKTKARVAMESEPGMSINGYPLRPESRGWLEIRSADPKAPLAIDANYLDTPKDQALAIGIIRFIRAFVAGSALAPVVSEEMTPGTDFQTDAQILDAWSRFGFTAYHLVGTCRMGRDGGSVVDPSLRVRGVEGLRVVDCSIFPVMPAGNTNAPVIAVAARACDLILSAASNQHQVLGQAA